MTSAILTGEEPTGEVQQCIINYNDRNISARPWLFMIWI